MMDGNFQAEHMKMRNPENDFPLTDGTGFMVSRAPYESHLKSAIEMRQVSTTSLYFNRKTSRLNRNRRAMIIGQLTTSTNAADTLNRLELVQRRAFMGHLCPILLSIFKREKRESSPNHLISIGARLVKMTRPLPHKVKEIWTIPYSKRWTLIWRE